MNEDFCYYKLYLVIDVKRTANRCALKGTTAIWWVCVSEAKVTTGVQLGLTHD